MKGFIEVTGAQSKIPHWVSIDQLVYIKRDGDRATLRFSDGSILEVSEGVGDILSAIKDACRS